MSAGSVRNCSIAPPSPPKLGGNQSRVALNSPQNWGPGGARNSLAYRLLGSKRIRRLRRGVTLIEVLAASLVIAVCVSALVGLWSLSFAMTGDIYDQDIACTLARNTLETIRENGFYYTAEAPASTPVVHYYDGNQNNLDSKPSSARYKVTTTVVSDRTISGSNPVQPAEDALRTVTITVTPATSGKILYQTNTYLVRAGL